MIPGYADEHFRGAITAGLRLCGMDVATPQERKFTGQPDEAQLAIASAEGRLMLTNDQDFLAIHAAWRTAGKSHAGIVYWHQDKYPIGEAIRRILDYASNTAPVDAANVVKYL